MASTFLDEKISSFIEDKFPEFVKSDHPVFVDFLRLYYQFMEAAKITLTNVQLTDQVLLENKLTDNFMLNEDGTKFVYEDSTYGAFIKGETITGQTSGAVAEILAEDNANGFLYVEQNRFLQVGEVIIGSTSVATATISKYQGNPVQNIQQLLEYVDIDKTITDFFDRFRNTYLTSIPNTLATGVSKRKLVKNIRDLYRAKGTKKGHETFFRLMFGETPELFYPTDNLLKISAGDWTSDTVIRVVATANSPNNLVGQIITQTTDPGLDATTATASVESTLQLQEGEVTVYQLLLNLDSIDGTFITGAEISGTDNTNADIAVTATIQSILVDTTVTDGSSGYTTGDTVTVTSTSGKDSLISIVDVGSGEVDQVIIDNPGTGYAIGDNLYFNNANTEGSGASATVVNIGGAVQPEAGDVAEYGMVASGVAADHIIYEDATESGDVYSGGQMQLETQTFTDLSVTSEEDEIVNVIMNSKGSGYEVIPTVVATEFRLYWSVTALTTSGDFSAGETITNNAGTPVTGIIATLRTGIASVASTTGSFAQGQIITGATSGAIATLTSVTTLGANATFVAWSSSGIGSVTGVEVSKFGTGFLGNPTVTVPIKLVITRNTAADPIPNISTATAFAVGDTISGQTSSATGVVTAWDNTRQLLTVRTTLGTFQRGEILTRGVSTNYAYVSETAQATLTGTIGVVGTTAGSFANDKGKISESLMKIQDSYYYQDFSYVVRVGSAIASWRAEIKKSVHPAGFAMFGEVSLSNKVEVKLTVPVSGITSATPALASLFEAVITTVIGMRLGTDDAGTGVPQSVPTQVEVTGDIRPATSFNILFESGTTGVNATDLLGDIDYLIMEDDSTIAFDNDGTDDYVAPVLNTVTFITTTNLVAGYSIAGLSLPVGTTISSISVASSGAHNNGTIILSQNATGRTENERLFVTVPYTTTYAYGTTILGETVIRGTTDQKTSSTLKRGYHLGHKTPLTSIIESITRSSTTATVETTGPHGVEAGEVVEISGVSTTGYNGVHEVVSAADDTFTFTVSNSLATPAVLGTNASVLLISPFDTSTRDVTLRSYRDVRIYPIYGGWATNQRDRYGLGPRQSNAIKYMFSAPPVTGDSVPTRLAGLEYAYPNITRRKSPEARTDNVDAGSLVGNYDNAFGYTIIQIGTHESNSHMPIGLFGDIKISDIIRGSRTTLETALWTGTTFGDDEDIEHLIMEDGSTIEMEGEYTMPQTSRKIWNVPPPSYVRLITA
jgi:hypothetical protein